MFRAPRLSSSPMQPHELDGERLEPKLMEALYNKIINEESVRALAKAVHDPAMWAAVRTYEYIALDWIDVIASFDRGEKKKIDFHLLCAELYQAI